MLCYFFTSLNLMAYGISTNKKVLKLASINFKEVF